MKILISCCGGNTSNVLAAKLRKYLKEQKIETKVKACAELNIERHIEAGDILLLAPQNYLSEARIASIQTEHDVRVIRLPYDIFGDLDAEKTYALIQTKQDNHKEKLPFYKRVLNVILDMNKKPIFDRLQRSFRSLFKPTMLGMLANLLIDLPLGSWYQDIIMIPIITKILNLIILLTIQSASLYLVFTWGYLSVEGNRKRRMFMGFVCLACFFFSMPSQWMNSYSEFVGIQSLFVALIVGMLATSFKGLIDRYLNKLHPSSNDRVHDVLYLLLLPILFTIIVLLLNWIGFSSLNELVAAFINAPLQKLAGSWNIYLFLTYVTILPWFFGIHGGMFINTVFMGIYTQAAFGNMQAYISGMETPYPMYSLFIWVSIGGTGCTLALNVLMLRAKSKKLRKNGKQSLLTSIFNVNEPLIFGVPIAYNLILFLPFVLVPTINLIVSYVCIFMLHIVAMPTGMIDTMGFLFPMGVNAIISTQSITGGILSIVLFAIDLLIWYPFFRKYDESLVSIEEVSCHNLK